MPSAEIAEVEKTVRIEFVNPCYDAQVSPIFLAAKSQDYTTVPQHLFLQKIIIFLSILHDAKSLSMLNSSNSKLQELCPSKIISDLGTFSSTKFHARAQLLVFCHRQAILI